MTRHSQSDYDSPTATRRKREIAEAARAELLEKGFEGLRMRAVADRCGINVATLDYHAGGKDGLIALVAASLVEDFIAIRDMHDFDPMTGLEELAEEIVIFRKVRQAKPDIHPVMATLSRRTPNEPAIAQHILPVKEAWLAKLHDIIAKGMTDGSIRSGLEPEASARLFIWSLISMGSPEQAHLDFPLHATELLKHYAAGPVPSLQGRLT